MAITNVGVLSSFFTKSSHTNWAATTFWAGGLTAGDICFLVVFFDNLTTTDTQSNNCLSITSDTHVSGWSKVAEYTNGNGSAGTGASVAIFKGVYVSNPGNWSLTINFSGSVGSKGFLGYAFRVGSGNDLQLARSLQVTLADAATACGSIATGALPSKEYLYFRGVGYEGIFPDDGNPTVTGGWGGTVTGTTGGGAASNMSGFYERIIATDTGRTSAPSLAVARDSASILTVWEEFTPTSFSPLDDFGSMGIFGI